MADSSEVDAAIIAKLASDATLTGMLPDGVFFDVAPPGSTRFVYLAVIEWPDDQVFRARGYEGALYQIEARALSTAGVNMKAAAARIDQLLDQQPLVAVGYSTGIVFREQRIRKSEYDETDPDLLWHRRGGEYRVVVSA